jgi:hypothetical protein
MITLMTEAVSAPETSPYLYETSQRSIPEDCHFHEYIFYWCYVAMYKIYDGVISGVTH